jgi:hypothetical protein
VVDGDEVRVDNAVDDQIEKLGRSLFGTRLHGALQNLLAYARGVADADDEVAADEQENTGKTDVAILHRLNVFEDEEEIIIRSLSLEAFIVAAAILNVEWMELKLPGQLVQLRIIRII